MIASRAIRSNDVKPRLAYGPDVICVVPIGRVLPGVVERIVNWLREVFGLPVIIGKLPIDHAGAFNATRGQYDSRKLLFELREHCTSRAVRMIGITESDLCNLILDFVFGEAQLDGNVAICSAFRLREGDDAGVGPERVQGRLAKVVLHELGHVFGLGHCEQPACAMCEAQCVEDIDRKQAIYCPSCLQALKWEIRRRTHFPEDDALVARRAA
jgi:archaemetzincin